jgi:riboflavin biosynthesis pyrimidine reductase
MHRIWPDPDPRELDDTALTSFYAVADRSVPHLRVNFVTSVDGAVSVDSYSAGLSGPADKRVFKLLRDLCDALLVGAGTLRHEGYRPLRFGPERVARRVAAGVAEQPTLVVVSSRLDMPVEVLAGSAVRPIVLTHAAAPQAGMDALADVADVLAFGETSVDLRAGLSALAARGLTQVLCEGGPHLFGALTAADAVDEMCLTLAPLLAGPGCGRITAGPPLPDPRQIALAHALEEDGNLFLRYVRH